ncbi:CBS domain-containing protein [Thioalkalivibrio sp.]|uniref:CBS domain-containing protein n=1 Tax=Thioalkalivibrio sp. TaxID=2093813 RepID=UPI003567947A
MIIGELSMHSIPVLPPEATLVEAGRALQAAATPVLAVIQDGALLGTISERDLAVKGCGAGLKPEDVNVAAICERRPAVCPSATRLSQALGMMQKRSQPWLLVLDGEERLAGVVSLNALISVLADLVPEEGSGPEPGYVRRVRGGTWSD